MGYVYDAEAKAVRQVSGVPGAAVLEANASSGAVERAWVSSLGFAVAQSKQGGSARLLNLETGNSTPLGELASAAAGGRFAAIATGSSIEIWDGVNASRTAKFDVTGTVRAVAASPDGAEVLAATGTSLLRLSGEGSSTLWSGDDIGGVAYIDGGFAAYDAGRNKLLVSRGGATSETDGPLAGATAFAALDSGRLAFGGERAIVVFDASSGAVAQAVTVENPVEELLPLSAGVAQVRFRGNARVALLEWNAAQTAAQVEFLVVAGGAR